jgi:hypothetical protein
VLGVSPTGPGFSSFQIKPYPGTLTWAQGQVSTQHGPIEVKWEAGQASFSLNMNIPNATICDLFVPLKGQGKVLLDGKSWNATTTDNGWIILKGLPAGVYKAEVS